MLGIHVVEEDFKSSPNVFIEQFCMSSAKRSDVQFKKKQNILNVLQARFFFPDSLLSFLLHGLFFALTEINEHNKPSEISSRPR